MIRHDRLGNSVRSRTRPLQKGRDTVRLYQDGTATGRRVRYHPHVRIASCLSLGGLNSLVLTSCAVVGTFIAAKGLVAWRKQLQGTADFDTARHVLRESFRYADALRSVRHPFMSSSEFPPQIQGESERDYDHRRVRVAYAQRWMRVDEAASTLGAAMLEAKVLWGVDFESRFEKIRSCRNELRSALESHLLSRESARTLDPEEMKRVSGIVFGAMSKEDGFETRLTEACDAIGSAVSPYLKR